MTLEHSSTLCHLHVVTANLAMILDMVFPFHAMDPSGLLAINPSGRLDALALAAHDSFAFVWRDQQISSCSHCVRGRHPNKCIVEILKRTAKLYWAIMREREREREREKERESVGIRMQAISSLVPTMVSIEDCSGEDPRPTSCRAWAQWALLSQYSSSTPIFQQRQGHQVTSM